MVEDFPLTDTAVPAGSPDAMPVVEMI